MSKWISIKLNELANYINGRSFKPEDWKEIGVPIIRIANLNNSLAPIDYFLGELDESHQINNGDILVSWSASLDAYIWNGGKAALNQHIFKVMPFYEIVEHDFLFYLLKYAMVGISNLVHGATLKHITKNDFEAFEVKIPRGKNEQKKIVSTLKNQLYEVDKILRAVNAQIVELSKLANSIIYDSLIKHEVRKNNLGVVLEEIKKGIGGNWNQYLVFGATREGLAPAKEPPGKKPQKYKPVFPGTVFYNPMRILIGSIAFVDEDDEPGITSPDYVALKGKEGVVDSRWFYYWLRSPFGEQCINSLARGAVRERMLFSRLAEGEIELPDYNIQQKASRALAQVKSMKRTFEQRLKEINLLPQKILSQAFEMN